MRRRSVLKHGGAALLGSAITGCISGSPPAQAGQQSDFMASPTAGSWPRFGNDQRNSGYAPDERGPTEGTIRWRFDAGSPTALCSPTVVDGTVYTGSTGDPGDLFALDAGDGSVDWRFEGSGYFLSTPCVTHDTVFGGTFGKAFYAVDRETGEARWSVDLDHRIDSSSAIVADDTVYVGTIGEAPLGITHDNRDELFEDGALLAFDADTGEERWRYDTPDESSGPGMTDGEDIYGSPALADGTLYVATSHGRVVALDPDTGEKRWSTSVGERPHAPDEPPDHAELSSPTVVDGRVYVGAHGAGSAYALDAATGEVRWRAGLVGHNVRSSPAVADGTVYIGAYRVVGCLDSVDCFVAMARGSTGALHALDASTGREQWRADLRPDVRSSPAVTRESVLIGNGSGISAVDRRTGDRLWDVPVDEYVQSSPAVAGGVAYINDASGVVYAIGPAT